MTFKSIVTQFFISTFLFMAFVCLTPEKAWAQCFEGQTFTCFNQDDADLIFRDLTSAFAPTTVSGGSSLGKVFGIELGLVVSASKAPNTQQVIDNYDSDFEIPGIPMAGISGVVTFPFGLGVETTFVPKINIEEQASFESLNLGARWTITDVFPMWRLKIALRTSYMKSSASFMTEEDTGNPAVGIVTENAEFDISIFEVGAVMGLALPFIEPYVGASDLRSDGNFAASGTRSTGLPIVSVDENSKSSGLRVYGGLLFKLPFFRIGAELATYDNINRASVKLAFKF